MSWVLRLFFLLFLLAALAAGGLWWQLQQFMETPLRLQQSEGVSIELPRGGSLRSLADDLAARGYISDSLWLRIHSRLSGEGTDIQAGEYWLQAGITPRELLQKLEAGDVYYHQLTFVEGWTLTQLLEALKKQPLIKQTLVEGELSAEMLGVDWSQSLEGMFFPDTYQYLRGETDVELLRRAFDRMQQVLAEEWQGKSENLPYKSAYEALIMASLIERETGHPPERPMIAGVFVRRLQRGMRLQTDPAVIYGLLAKGFDGNLRSKHLKDASNPYNTYRHHGLTPTPIALAGREAIHAALHPAAGEALFFVAKGDGRHYFSKTLAEHQQAVRQYQINKRRKDYRSSPAPAQ